MINELIKIATHLDRRGLTKEADYLDAVIKKYAYDCSPEIPLGLEEDEGYSEDPWDLDREEDEAHDQVHT